MELVKKRVIETDIVRKRKLLKRRRFPTFISEASSEEYAVPVAKRTCQRRTRENKSPTLDALWLTLVKEATPFQLGKYFSE